MEQLIDKLQNYYGIAIRANVGNLAGIRKAIHASLMHCASSNPAHYTTTPPLEAQVGANTSKTEPIGPISISMAQDFP